MSYLNSSQNAYRLANPSVKNLRLFSSVRLNSYHLTIHLLFICYSFLVSSLSLKLSQASFSAQTLMLWHLIFLLGAMQLFSTPPLTYHSQSIHLFTIFFFSFLILHSLLDTLYTHRHSQDAYMLFRCRRNTRNPY